jgi:breast cancer 2 susceptibility protein
MITTQDSPAGSPMILVVSNVISVTNEKVSEDGWILQAARAEIEVSDGWYRLRAQVDAPLARAIMRKTLKPGKKIAIACARVSPCNR